MLVACNDFNLDAEFLAYRSFPEDFALGSTYYHCHKPKDFGTDLPWDHEGMLFRFPLLAWRNIDARNQEQHHTPPQSQGSSLPNALSWRDYKRKTLDHFIQYYTTRYVPILKPDLYWSLGHVNFLGDPFTNKGCRCRVFIELRLQSN